MSRNMDIYMLRNSIDHINHELKVIEGRLDKITSHVAELEAEVESLKAERFEEATA